MIKGEELIRIEHKLDAILTYLAAITDMPPIQMPKTIIGLGGLTDGKCPITGTSIYLTIDPDSGKPMRKDGLRSGLVETTLFPDPPAFSSTSVVLGRSAMTGDSDE